MGASGSKDRRQIHVPQSKWRKENEGYCSAIQRIFYCNEHSDGAYFAKEQMNALHEHSSPESLSRATTKQEVDYMEVREKLKMERAAKHKLTENSDEVKSKEFKKILRGGMQIRQVRNTALSFRLGDVSL
jgi:hypothetical protein